VFYLPNRSNFWLNLHNTNNWKVAGIAYTENGIYKSKAENYVKTGSQMAALKF